MVLGIHYKLSMGFLFYGDKVTVMLFYQTCVYSHALCLRNYLVE